MKSGRKTELQSELGPSKQRKRERVLHLRNAAWDITESYDSTNCSLIRKPGKGKGELSITHLSVRVH